MEDILSLVLVFLFYAAAAAMGGKKKKKRANRRTPDFDRMRRYAQENPHRPGSGGGEPSAANAQPQPEMRADMRTDMEKAFRRESGEALCHDTSRIHLHEVTSDVLDAAGEGEDPCHAGGEDAFAAHAQPERDGGEAMPASADADFRQELARDVLRGVIMSEILTRPCERRATYRNGRGVNG